MEFAIGGLVIALLFIGAALMKGGPTWVSAVVGWLAVWPVILGALVYWWTPARLPGGLAEAISSAVPLTILLPGMSALAGLAAVWRRGSVMVAFYAFVSVGLMVTALLILGV